MAVSRIDEAGLNVTQYGNRNLIINGAMQVAQRGTSVTGLTNGSNGCVTVDRFRFVEQGTPTFVLTATQSTDAPSGFSNSFKFEITTAQASLAAGDLLAMDTILEAQDLQRLGYGSSGAKDATLSFWVKSNVVGTYTVWLYQYDDARGMTKSYTIDAANTWEYKTISIPADATGVIDSDNGAGLAIRWALGSGTDYTSGTASPVWIANVDANRHAGQGVNLADTIGNTFQMTGVQLEVGDTATDFEHRSYGDELARCQRYFLMCKPDVASGITHAGFVNLNVRSTTARYGVIHFPVSMRTRPSVTYSGTLTAYSGSSSYTVSAIDMNGSSFHTCEMEITAASGATVGHGGWVRITAGAYVEFDSEL